MAMVIFRQTLLCMLEGVVGVICMVGWWQGIDDVVVAMNQPNKWWIKLIKCTLYVVIAMIMWMVAMLMWMVAMLMFGSFNTDMQMLHNMTGSKW